MDKSAIIVSISSDIGAALAERWLARGWKVFGTYRTRSAAVDRLEAEGACAVICDAADRKSVNACCTQLRQRCPAWDVLVIAHGTTEPVGPFMETDFDAWECSININFISQLRFTHQLLPARRTDSAITPTVIYFAGGGTNSATKNYSAYTVSKISLIKMCELLDAEIPSVKFSIVGPGWVNTKIHDETLRAGDKSGDNFFRTQLKIAQGDFTPMDNVLACCDWIVSSSRAVVSGRNFSTVYDDWGTDRLNAALLTNPDMYKLRRSGNDAIIA